MPGWCASARAAARRSCSGASPRVSLSGFPGATSHQTRSSPSRRIAIRQAARCASCGGSKVPPNRPMRMPRVCDGIDTRGGRITRVTNHSPTEENSRPDLSAAAHAILEARELLHADRAARMKATGGDADLRAKTEFAAIGELRRRIVEYDRRVDFAQKFLCRRVVLGDDRVGVVRAVAFDVGNRGVDAI